MIYLIKSIVCLIIFYGFYHFFLQPIKILIFNRYYLISSLIISMIIPLIIIPIESGFTITDNLNIFTIPVEQTLQSQDTNGISAPQIKYQPILYILFITISAILLIRYAININSIIRKADKCIKIEGINSTLVLVEEDILPYSFFKYVFVNKSDFENDKISKELLIHEEAHCSQYHSIDIIFLELMNVFFWFNPAIWLFRKAILLNHEYYADNTVMSKNTTCDYQQLLINLVIRNNSYYLVSNVKNALIKNRLIMMTKSKPLHNAILRKIAGVSLFLVMGVAFTLCQADKLTNDSSNLIQKSSTPQDTISDQWWKLREWWNPIVSKHGIKDELLMVQERFVLFGKKNINSDKESFNDVTAIQISMDGNYRIYKSNTASYDDKTKWLIINDCTMNTFEWNSKNTQPIKSWANINFKVDFIRGFYYTAGGRMLI